MALMACAAACGDEGGGTDLSAMGDLDAIGDADEVDLLDTTCTEPSYAPGACVAGERLEHEPPATNPHIDVPEPIEYADWPPAGGPHRPQWARWGEYSFLPPQRWVHNLEHGGAAFLYHPCAPTELVDELRTYAQALPDDEAGAFRWVMTPFPDLPSSVAVVTWGHVYLAECVQPDELDAFVAETYRQAPEDVGSNGPYSAGWVGR